MMKCAARIKPGFLPHFIILISQAVRGRTGQAAFLRSARAGPYAQVGWRQGKVFSQVFFKKLVGFGVKPQDLPGLQGVLVPGGHRSGPTEAAAETAAPAFLSVSKKGGRMSPSWGASATAPAATAFVLACRLGRPLGNVPPGRSGPLKRWTKLLLVSPELKRGLLGQRLSASSAALKRRARLVLRGHAPRLVQSGHGPG